MEEAAVTEVADAEVDMEMDSDLGMDMNRTTGALVATSGGDGGLSIVPDLHSKSRALKSKKASR